MNLLIIGGAGFVGANLARYFNVIDGCSVTVMDNLVRRGSEINLESFGSGIDFVHGDIRVKEDFAKLGGKRFSCVLNCAAQPSAINYSNPEFDYTNNTAGQLNVLEYCRKHRTPIILWSTNKVYPQTSTRKAPWKIEGKRYVWHYDGLDIPGWSRNGFNEKTPISGIDHSIYGASKASADILTQEWCDAFAIPGIINRFSCLSGPGQWGKAEQGWVAWFAIANILGLPLDIYGFDGYQVRDNLHINDLCALIHEQVKKLTGVYSTTCYGEVFNVGGGIGKGFSTSLLEAIDMIQEKTGKDFVDIKVHEDIRRADQAIYISDIRKVSEAFDWAPKVTVDETYDDIIAWVIQNQDRLKGLYNA